MVYLNKIYTKSGDGGETGLGDGRRVPKTHLRVRSYGSADELNAIVGVCVTLVDDSSIRDRLLQVQNDLFDLGADLCVPESTTTETPPLRITATYVDRLESWIDTINDELSPLTSFVLPGGSPLAAHLHHARAVCRRVEIAVLELGQNETINAHVPVYLNRLSDLLFVLARHANNSGRDDVLWQPGGA